MPDPITRCQIPHCAERATGPIRVALPGELDPTEREACLRHVNGLKLWRGLKLTLHAPQSIVHCQIIGCTAEPKIRGLCGAHYNRAQKDGWLDYVALPAQTRGRRGGSLTTPPSAPVPAPVPTELVPPESLPEELLVRPNALTPTDLAAEPGPPPIQAIHIQATPEMLFEPLPLDRPGDGTPPSDGPILVERRTGLATDALGVSIEQLERMPWRRLAYIARALSRDEQHITPFEAENTLTILVEQAAPGLSPLAATHAACLLYRLATS